MVPSLSSAVLEYDCCHYDTTVEVSHIVMPHQFGGMTGKVPGTRAVSSGGAWRLCLHVCVMGDGSPAASESVRSLQAKNVC